jgi:hypothetical protein
MKTTVYTEQETITEQSTVSKILSTREYWTNYTKIKRNLLLVKAFYVTGNNEDGLLWLFSFYYELWINIWGGRGEGGNPSQIANIFKIQKNIIELLQNAEVNSCRNLRI